MIYKILGVGHPRTGTGFTAKLLSKWGLNVGHERVESDGIVAWQFVKEHGPWPWINTSTNIRISFEHLIYNVRNPINSIPSIVYTENTNIQSLSFRKNAFNVIQYANPVDTAIDSIIKMDNLIMNLHPNIIFRIEDQQRELFDYISQYYPNLRYVEYIEKYNVRMHESFETLKPLYETCLSEHKVAINNYCEKYGYQTLQ